MSETDASNIDLQELIRHGTQGKLSLAGQTLLFLVFLIPVFVFGFGARMLYSFWDLRTHGVRTQAEVIRIEEERTGSIESNYYPVLRFQKQDGEVQESRSTRCKKHSLRSGDKVMIFYDREKPEKVVLDELVQFLTAPLILMVLGLVAGGFMVSVLRRNLS